MASGGLSSKARLWDRQVPVPVACPLLEALPPSGNDSTEATWPSLSGKAVMTSANGRGRVSVVCAAAVVGGATGSPRQVPPLKDTG